MYTQVPSSVSEKHFPLICLNNLAWKHFVKLYEGTLIIVVSKHFVSHTLLKTTKGSATTANPKDSPLARLWKKVSSLLNNFYETIKESWWINS